MAKKKSFVLYFDCKKQIDMLSDEQAGKLFKALFDFAESDEIPEFSDGMLTMAFSFISAQIERDSVKYEERCEKNRQIALEREKRKRERFNTNVNECKQTNTNNTDTDNDTDNDNGNEKKKADKSAPSPSQIAEIVDLYHKICTSYSKVTVISDTRKRALKTLMKKFSVEQIKTVFETAEKSDFLKGINNRNWKANFDWFIKESNFVKVLDGNYDNQQKKDNSDGFDASEYEQFFNQF